jgi:hypothetical protein
MQSAVIFTMKVEKIRKLIQVRQRDWMCGKLTDYGEVKQKTRSSPLFQIATAISCSDEVIEENLVEQIVRIMYSNSEYSGYARGVVVRVVRMNPQLVKAWGRGLFAVVKEKQVCNDLWRFVWRDCRFMEKETRMMIEEEIWSGSPEVGAIGSIISAFSYLECR